MLRFLTVVGSVVILSWSCMAQQGPSPTQQGTGSTVIGCLSGPDGDDHYTLTSMQHRLGVDVTGSNVEVQSEALKKGSGSKVKLTGSWEPMPGPEGAKGDAAKRFKVTDVAVMDEKCQPPTAVTPLSKKKQAEQQSQQQPKK